MTSTCKDNSAQSERFWPGVRWTKNAVACICVCNSESIWASGLEVGHWPSMENTQILKPPGLEKHHSMARLSRLIVEKLMPTQDCMRSECKDDDINVSSELIRLEGWGIHKEVSPVCLCEPHLACEYAMEFCRSDLVAELVERRALCWATEFFHYMEYRSHMEMK